MYVPAEFRVHRRPINSRLCTAPSRRGEWLVSHPASCRRSQASMAGKLRRRSLPEPPSRGRSTNCFAAHFAGRSLGGDSLREGRLHGPSSPSRAAWRTIVRGSTARSRAAARRLAQHAAATRRRASKRESLARKCAYRAMARGGSGERPLRRRDRREGAGVAGSCGGDGGPCRSANGGQRPLPDKPGAPRAAARPGSEVGSDAAARRATQDRRR